MKWCYQVYLMEFRKLFAYRVDFWVNFLGQTAITLLVAYYLWSAIFEANQVTQMNGFSINGMIFYYLIVPLISKIQRANSIGSISREIYDGNFNKYIVYPIGLYRYKISTSMAQVSFYIFQIIFVIALYSYFFDLSEVVELKLTNILLLLLILPLSSITYFCMNSMSELLAFWFDNIWSLGVILNFLASFLGGAMIPLSFFPGWALELLKYTPFPYLINFPMQVLTNKLEFTEILFQSSILGMWMILFVFCSKLLYKKGMYQYTGVGI